VRAAVLFGPEDLRVAQVPEPAGEVIVEVQAATTCGTDVKMWRHGHRVLGPYPSAFGHETAGVRADTGERVLVSDSVACGACDPCRTGRTQICREPIWVLGGFAERIGAPEAALHRIPDGLPAAVAAMAEPFAAAIHAVARGTDAGDVGVLGGGPMGLMLAALLVAEGRSVTLADPHAERRAQAARIGATARESLARHELVFEAVGRTDAWRAAAAAAAPGAVVVFVGGCPGGAEVSLPTGPLHYEELELRGSFHHSPDEVDTALGVLAGEEVLWRTLLGPTIALEQLPAALATPNRGPAKKWVVDPRMSSVDPRMSSVDPPPPA
jgi:L-iditol 2-dehydrogenase